MLALDLKTADSSYMLVLDKDELITLVALVHEGLESMQQKTRAGSQLAKEKYEGAMPFVAALNKKILSG